MRTAMSRGVAEGVERFVDVGVTGRGLDGDVPFGEEFLQTGVLGDPRMRRRPDAAVDVVDEDLSPDVVGRDARGGQDRVSVGLPECGRGGFDVQRCDVQIDAGGGGRDERQYGRQQADLAQIGGLKVERPPFGQGIEPRDPGHRGLDGFDRSSQQRMDLP
jgi:hypothetical protein